jgi:hypothetical protein
LHRAQIRSFPIALLQLMTEAEEPELLPEKALLLHEVHRTWSPLEPKNKFIWQFCYEIGIECQIGPQVE